jgi:hypothetical protein
MSVVDMFLRQTAQWQKKLPDSEDMFGVAQFGPPITIPCRAVRTNKNFSDDMGNNVTSNYNVLTAADVEIGDKLTIDGVEMTAIAENLTESRWFTGEKIGVWLRCARRVD